MNTPVPDLTGLVGEIFAAALRAVEPEEVIFYWLAQHPRPTRAPHILALGKAAPAMARGATAWLKTQGLEPAGGVVIGTEPSVPPHPALKSTYGDHPEPGTHSAAAAEALGEACKGVKKDDLVWVLLSGGSSSLLGAPVAGLEDEDYQQLCQTLLKSGRAITEVNRIRKRFSRWGAGRLATALAGAEVVVMAVSDVFGDDFSAIGSGPCVGDPATADQVLGELRAASFADELPPAVFHHLEEVSAGRATETPKPSAGSFKRVTHHVVAGNRMAVQAAAQEAENRGYHTTAPVRPIVGEASEVGKILADTILKRPPGGPWCAVWGGEATVTLGKGSGRGGRCQEIALAAAERLALMGGKRQIVFLAAGTDGRDGPTDAAGAIVTPETWGNIKTAGRDPSADLKRHDAYNALDAAGALLRIGATGTNVNDVVIAVEV